MVGFDVGGCGGDGGGVATSRERGEREADVDVDSMVEMAWWGLERVRLAMRMLGGGSG